MNEEMMKEFKLFREQVYVELNNFEKVLRGLHDQNSEAIDEILIAMLESEGESDV